jgi:nicotinate-nucleotide pyrophosphorylase (carboxylating)
MMAFSAAEASACRHLVELSLQEDLGATGDLTSSALIPADYRGAAQFVARQAGVVAGLPAVAVVLSSLDPSLHFQRHYEDGMRVPAGGIVAWVAGTLRSLLTGERTALNFLQRLSGIATLTRAYVEAVQGLPCQILDTRKTTPGWRLLEKYAVRCGGGHNHRLGLYDGVLIKDNHLAALGGEPLAISRAIRAAREAQGPARALEVEVDNLEQLEEALACGPDIVLLDNMSPDDLRTAVRRRNATAPGVRLEASGGVTLATVRAIAETGVDCISVGALTHSAPALDIALDYMPK